MTSSGQRSLMSFLTKTLKYEDPNDEVIGMDGDGNPLTRGMLLKRIELSEKAVENGEVVSQEEAIKTI